MRAAVTCLLHSPCKHNRRQFRQFASTGPHAVTRREGERLSPSMKSNIQTYEPYIYYMHRLKHKHKHMHIHMYIYICKETGRQRVCVCVMNIYITKPEVNPIVTRKCDRAIYSICLITSRLASPAKMSYSLCLIMFHCFLSLFPWFYFHIRAYFFVFFGANLLSFYLFLPYCG